MSLPTDRTSRRRLRHPHRHPHAPSRVALAALAIFAPLAVRLADAQTIPRGAHKEPAGFITDGTPSASTSAAHVEKAAVASLRAAVVAAKSEAGGKGDDAWVAPTSDGWIERLGKRAQRDSAAGKPSAVAAMIAIAQIGDDARAGSSRKALDAIAATVTDKSTAEAATFAHDAATMSLALSADIGTPSGHAAEAKLGLVSAWRLAGPFKDSSGAGLDKAEGPELAGPSLLGGKPLADKPRPLSIELFRDGSAHWAEGAFEARWTAVPPQLVSARGVPLDVLVYPRKETCTYLASALDVVADGPLVVRVASAGSVRVIFD
ncbi:MAG: hypothetical protein ACHREM_33740, partial [Polyangiales bacterium]